MYKSIRIVLLSIFTLIFIFIPYSSVSAEGVTAYAEVTGRASGKCVNGTCCTSYTYTGASWGSGSGPSRYIELTTTLRASGIYGVTRAGWAGTNAFARVSGDKVVILASGYPTRQTQTTTASIQWIPYDGYSAVAAYTDTHSASLQGGVNLDNTPPNGNCSFNYISGVVYGSDGNAYACGGSVKVKFSAADRGCAGVEAFERSFGYGSQDKRSQATDRLGNTSLNYPCVADWKIDCDSPNCSGRTISQSTWNWTNSNVTVSASGCSDSGVGMKGCTTATATAEDQTVTMTCSDLLGNKINVSHKVTNIDKSSPNCVGSGYEKPTAGIYVREAIPAWGSCSDSRSGCTQSTYYASIANGHGTITLRDNVGNEGSCTINYDFWDGSKPTTTITFDDAHKNNSDEEYTIDDKITVTISATDSGKSGVDRVCYKLEGETTQDAVCHKGNTYSFDISNEGITNITAWSFDKAYDYDGGFVYNPTTSSGGNRSNDAKKSAYIDRTKPNLTSYTADDDGILNADEIIMSLTSDYDNIKDSTPWVNIPIIVNVGSLDTEYRDGSRSGVGTVEYYWGLTDDMATVWGDEHTNRVYNTNNEMISTNPETLLDNTYYNVVTADYSKRHNFTPAISNPANNNVLNDELYLHIRVCDRSTTYNGQKAPNCTTAVYGPVYYDDMPPNVLTPVTPTDDKTPTNPSTDPDNPTTDPSSPVGGTGSEIVDPDAIKNNDAMDQHDWTNRLVIGFVAYEHMQNSEVNTGEYKDNSGLDRIEFYYDRSYNHEPTTLDKNSFTTLDNVRRGCSAEKVCAYYLDFNSLSNYPEDGQYSVMEEGNRFMMVRVHDVAGNYKDFYFGPYKFDITPNIINNIEFLGQAGTIIEK